MDEIKQKKEEIRLQIIEYLKQLPERKLNELNIDMINRLFGLANFFEAAIVLLYIGNQYDPSYKLLIKETVKTGKIVALPFSSKDSEELEFFKIDNLKQDLIKDKNGVLKPDISKCKKVPADHLDIALIPGFAFDEKGGRLGLEECIYNDEIIPNLPITVRKVSVCFEEQIIPNIPMEANDKYVDIIVSSERIIYKI
ncbi:MAG: 5-formyltetrahydrofolate cyclo-ligase [Deltaproteobacteria bacterium]|nr:5-formyltetrahydrofolate cyclo-ligase [Deltaproteobacteria bacterium]